MKLRQFFPYYGAKWKLSCWYPEPKYKHIIEPFAGSAGYSTRYSDRKVTLVDANEQVAGTWQYLIKATPEEIRRLPIKIEHVGELMGCHQEARWLIGWWLGRARMRPGLRPSAWMKTGQYHNRFWGESVRDRIAAQVDHIKHWKAVQGDVLKVTWKPQTATWFIDPPYENGGKHYRNHSVDRNLLKIWVLNRRGQTIVCGSKGENWLPFKPLREHQGIQYRRTEMIYEAHSEKIPT